MKRWILRSLAGAFILAGLTGPAPGNIGGCGAANEGTNPRQFCADRKYWECRRDEFANNQGVRVVSTETTAACYSGIETSCSGANVWPEGCAPTPAQLQSCLDLLGRGDLVGLTTPELMAMYSDCNLCP